MGEQKHTPGPWRLKFDPYEDGVPYCIINAGEGGYGDDGTGFNLTVICCEADGRLIAAAPDMLALLRDIASRFDDAKHPHSLEWSIREKCRAAIAKATEPQP